MTDAELITTVNTYFAAHLDAVFWNARSEAEKTAAAAGLLTLIHDIELNWNEVGGDGLSAWSVLDKLIRYLPTEDEAE